MRHRAGLSFYCDDVIIYTSTISGHLSLLDQMLSLLIDNDLKCSVSKSYFLYTSIDYLGRTISKDGISIPKTINRTLDKIENMQINTPKATVSFGIFAVLESTHLQLGSSNVSYAFTDAQRRHIQI